MSSNAARKHLQTGTAVALVVVEVAAVLLGALGGGGGDGDVLLNNSDLEDLAVLGDVLGGDDVAAGVVLGVVEGRSGGDGGSGDLGVLGGGAVGVGALGVLLIVTTKDGRGGLVKETLGRLAGGARAGLASVAGRLRLGRASLVGVAADARVLGSVLRAVLHRDTKRDTVLDAHDVLVSENLGHVEVALAGLALVLDGEQRAVLNASRGVLAGVESVLEELLRLPAHDEISVVTSTGGVTHGKSELAVLASEELSGPDGLVEKEGVVHIVPLGALALLDQVGVGNVAVVVVGVGLTGTAARETDLETHAVRAVLVHVRLGWKLVAVERRLRVAVVVEAVEAESALGQPELVIGLLGPGAERLVGERAVEVTSVLVTSDGTEALREGLDVVHVVEVVGKKTTDLGNNDRGAIVVDEVKRRGPVSGLVLLDGARGASVGRGQVLVGALHGELLIGIVSASATI